MRHLLSAVTLMLCMSAISIAPALADHHSIVAIVHVHDSDAGVTHATLSADLFDAAPAVHLAATVDQPICEGACVSEDRLLTADTLGNHAFARAADHQPAIVPFAANDPVVLVSLQRLPARGVPSIAPSNTRWASKHAARPRGVT